MKIKKLNNKGFSHAIILMAFIMVFAIAGVGYLVITHAASSKPRCAGRTFKPGNRGSCVSDLQYGINVYHAHYARKPAITVDGTYGSATKKAVTGLTGKSDGVVRPGTWKALCSYLYESRNSKAGKAHFDHAGCKKFPGWV